MVVAANLTTCDVSIGDHIRLPADLKSRLELENMPFISKEQLESEARHQGLSEAETQEAVRINTKARLTGSVRLNQESAVDAERSAASDDLVVLVPELPVLFPGLRTGARPGS